MLVPPVRIPLAFPLAVLPFPVRLIFPDPVSITEAVSTQVWSGDAVVHVSIVNWVKGEKSGKKKLSIQLGDNENSPWETVELDYINSALSAKTNVTQAKKILANANSEACYQGQTHGHE
jgi:hypothetical protein